MSPVTNGNDVANAAPDRSDDGDAGVAAAKVKIADDQVGRGRGHAVERLALRARDQHVVALELEQQAGGLGHSAHGDGPVARSFGVPDLTKITQRYGNFPTNVIRDTIDGRGARVDAHGTRTMPVWGYEFYVEEGGDVTAQQEMRKAIAKLVDYLRSIQTDKAPSAK